MTSPLPVLQYLVAFQNGPLDDPALITTVASPAGTLGGANVWTDITAYVDSHQISRGRQHELQQMEAGTLQLHLNNQDGRFSPWNTSSPYTGFLLPRKLVQVRAVWSAVTYTRFTGHVDAWPVEWPDPVSGWASLHATDAFRLFNGNNITSTGYATQVLADGASGYWRLGDPVGSTAIADLGPNGFTGNIKIPSTGFQTPVTFGNGGLMVADPVTSAVIGASPTAGYASFPGSGISTGSSFSFNFWVKYVGTGSGTSALINIGDGTNSAFMVFSPSLGAKNNNGGSNASASGFLATIISGQPVMVTAVFTAGVGWTLYVNGAVAPNTGGVATTSGNPAVTDITDQGDFEWQDFATFPSALNAAQVAALYNLATIPQQSTDARISRILDIVGWSSGARTLDAGSSTVQAVSSSLTSTSSLSHMQQVEGTESGALYLTGDGKVRFVSRQNMLGNSLYTTSQQTIGDNISSGDMPFQPGPVIAIDDIDIYNEAVAARSGGNTQRTTDATSITAYARTTWQPPTTLLGISDSEVLNLTQYVVGKYKTPVTRIQSVTVDLLELITPNTVAHLLTLDLLQRVTVERTSPPGGGTGFSQVANIEHITEQVAPDSWKVTFALAVADPAWWVLGTAQLGTSTRLAF